MDALCTAIIQNDGLPAEKRKSNVALAEAPIKGKNVFEYNKNCNGAKDYMALAQEVLKLK